MSGTPDQGSGDAVELSGIWKRFPGVVANRDINLRVRAGTVHSLVGENGAGKSTLMKTLYGMHRPDDGTMRVNGVQVSFASPTDAIGAGIGMVHQHFMLADNLTVLENVILGSEPHRRGVIDQADARRRVNEVATTHGIELNLDGTVGELGVGERQRVEIVKVLYRGARILILDEPTAVLVPQEVTELFANLRQLVADGVTIIFISHKLDEVLAISDDITVIRAGTTVATVKPSEVDRHDLGLLMVGSELPDPSTEPRRPDPAVALAVRSVTSSDPSGRAAVDDVSFELHRGEILGIAGVDGNGQFELVECILGLRPCDAGAVEIAGADADRMSLRERRRAGLGYVAFDRHREALLLASPLWENALLAHDDEPRYRRGPFVNRRAAVESAKAIIEQFAVAAPGPDAPAFALSGGNQQKFIVGREMLAGPEVLIAAHPTRGVDIGAQAAIWEEIRAARREGMAVLLISADLDELIGLSDRLLVMCGGVVTAELDPATATPENLGVYMAGERQEAAL